MSFAYIDSQGKEVSIPGPDALRLRIELGAITDSTRFYDAAQDRWGAASEHEIYRQLKRDIATAQTPDFPSPSVGGLGGDPDLGLETGPLVEEEAEAPADEDVDVPSEGFIDDFEWAAEHEPHEDVAGEEPADIDLSDLDFDEPEDLDPAPLEPDLADLGSSDDDEADDLDAGDELEGSPEPYFAAELDAGVLDQTFDEAESHDASDDPTADDLMWPEGATADELDEGMDAFTLAEPGVSSVAEDHASARPSEGHSEDDSGDENDVEDVGFDFGSDTLELEEDDTEPADAEAPEDDVSLPQTGADADEIPASSVEDEAPDFGMVFEGGAPDDSFAEEGDPDPDQLTTEDDASSSDESGRGAGAAAATGDDDPGSDDPYQRNIPERRGPRSRPPRRGGGSGAIRVAAGFLVVAAVGAAAVWFMTGSGDEVAQPAEVALPALPAELEPQFRELAQNASSGMVSEFDSLPRRLVLPDQPGSQWLSGPYLSNASSFGGVVQYWEDFDALLDEIVASEDDLWATAWDEQLAQADLAPETEARLRERGMLGWAAAAPDREVIHGQLRGVIDAALDLHRFLVENESAITYDPSTGGGAGDPVLEVVTATPDLGDEMWMGVGEITVALDALGYVQQVETEPLLDAVRARLVTVGIR